MDRLCAVRDIYRAVHLYEEEFQREYGLCLNEGMLLCSLDKADMPLSAGELAGMLGLSPSNTSKVIRAVERKGFVARVPGDEDKRLMYLSLTAAGREWNKCFDCGKVEVPAVLNKYLETVDG